MSSKIRISSRFQISLGLILAGAMLWFYWPISAHARGEHVVLVVDEAQNLGPKALEELRLLSKPAN